MPIIRIETTIDAGKKIVFDLARSIDLHKYSTHQTNEEAVAGITSGLIGMNESVTWRARHFGIYQTLTSKITAYCSPDYFSDEMVKGIFKSLKHDHIFESKSNQTLMIDVFDYVSPLGMLGRVVDVLFLKRYMRSFLEKRNRMIKEFAESDKWKGILNEKDEKYCL